MLFFVGRDSSVGLATIGWVVRGWNLVAGDIFRTRPDWPLDPTQPPVH
jgi:hypothetical protein